MTDKPPQPPQNRPLSPHLTIYRPQMSSMTSILVRISGLSLIVAFFLISGWVWAAAVSPKAFDFMTCVLTHPIGIIILSASLWALFYHSLGGIRHLIWDMGAGLSVQNADRMGWIMIIGSVVLTALCLLYFGGVL